MIDFICIGIGGSGQTYFMRYLNKKSISTNNLCDKDRIKHISTPKKIPKKYKNHKIIYIFNNSFDAICSHYRRDWPVYQMNKINLKRNVCKISNVEKYFEYTEKNMNDIFGCEKHFLRLFNDKYNNNIYFVNLNNFNKIDLSRFMGVNKSFFDDFDFDISKRHDYSSLKKKYPFSNIMYKNIDKKIDELAILYNKNVDKKIRLKNLTKTIK